MKYWFLCGIMAISLKTAGVKMNKIMFVCHGNICRSPMAEFVFKKLVADAGRQNEFEICSRATSTEEISNPVYPPAKRELMRHGIDCSGKVAIQLKKNDYNNYDMFICMDDKNVKNALRIFGCDPAGKLKKMMQFVGEARDVADPWYTGDFETTYNDVFSGCTELLKTL